MERKELDLGDILTYHCHLLIMSYLAWFLIPFALIGLSLIIHRRLIKINPIFIKKNENINNFSFLAHKAFFEFFKPQKTYLWTLELSELKNQINFSPAVFKGFLNTLEEEDLKNLWQDYDLILYWNKNERIKLSEAYEVLNPQLYAKEIDRLDAQINHRIMKAFVSNPNLLLEIENYLFYQSLTQKKVIR